MEAEALGDFFKVAGKSTKKLWKDASIPLWAFEIASKLGIAAETKNPKATTGECIKVVQKTKRKRFEYKYKTGYY